MGAVYRPKVLKQSGPRAVKNVQKNTEGRYFPSMHGPEQAWLIRDLLNHRKCLETNATITDHKFLHRHNL